MISSKVSNQVAGSQVAIVNISLAKAVPGVEIAHRHIALSRRERAVPLREEIDELVALGCIVDLDCHSVEVTQSFMDELVGILVLERGLAVLKQLRFRGCSADMKGIIKFVVSDRAAQHAKSPHFFAPR